ncbi:MAG: o-succinylbenzoate synthase [Bacteroidota bacterium]
MDSENIKQELLLTQSISLRQIDLHIIELPQKQRFSSGIGVRNSREALIVKWTTEEGTIGYGECACRPDPYYSAEYLHAAADMIRRFVLPQLKKQQTYGELLALLGRIRGWNFTKTAVEAAAFSILEQRSAISWSELFPVKALERVPVGISLGLYEDKQLFYETVAKAIQAGYHRLKFKISPKADPAVFDHINPLLFEHKVHLGFDANGSFAVNDLDQLDYFVQTYQTIIEQPFPPHRFDVLLAAKERFAQLRICADEEVKSIGDLIKLHQLGAIDELNLKVGRVGGIYRSIEILNYCHQHQLPCWIGGMFESGIGRLVNLRFASLLPHAKAHDLSPSARYFHEDIISPEVTMENGFVRVALTEESKVTAEKLEKYTNQKITETI